ncbi:hypothetical protein M413DRAFT_35636, partial [Hebeloma cylindrosporum]
SVTSGSIDTPMSHNSHGSEEGYEKLKDLELAVKIELEGHMYRDESFGKNAFVGKVAPDKDIEKFLLECDLYDSDACRWRDVPEKPLYESELYDPFCDVFEAAIGHFYPASDSNPPTRIVLDSHDKQLQHRLGPEDGRIGSSSPDFMIQGSGRNFPPPPRKTKKNLRRTAYAFCATPLEIKRVSQNVFEANMVQIAVYARECFVVQSNRFFVYSMIITEKYAQLYLFDRSGGHYSHRVDIHANATDFVRFMLGVASPDDAVIGFDTQIYWEGKQRVLETINDQGIVEKYNLEDKKLFYRRAIRGRGTCCWITKDGRGKVLIVKDAWRSRERLPEWKFLKAAKGLTGVGQMVAYFPGAHVSDHRGLDITTIPDDMKSYFWDRTFCRMVLEGYGKSIVEFDTADEVLFAFRDAIAGHQNLWNSNILHRDVSINNILIGIPGAEEGWRGVLIDLDMAIWLDRAASLAEADFRTGTRAFQSVRVLKSFLPKKARMCHDYLDDLESFFYVLIWICIGYSQPGKMVEPIPELLSDWESENPIFAARTKVDMYFTALEEMVEVTPFFGVIFQELLENVHGFFSVVVHRKTSSTKGQVYPTLTELIPEASGHYATILGFVDDAIKKRAAL